MGRQAGPNKWQQIINWHGQPYVVRLPECVIQTVIIFFPHCKTWRWLQLTLPATECSAVSSGVIIICSALMKLRTFGNPFAI